MQAKNNNQPAQQIDRKDFIFINYNWFISFYHKRGQLQQVEHFDLMQKRSVFRDNEIFTNTFKSFSNSGNKNRFYTQV